ncbi:hypothetical protein DL765_001912 [Monosporascus sp. GIB2]|nr:hypothetical protein DL765_001912 [Monosporascus sp. GIB2]
MAPIRVALIGLSRSAKVSWAAEGHLPYLLSLRGRSHYEIVALLNSSISAAEAARDHYGLPATVKVYGDPKQLAADQDVDLVVCVTRVDTHVALTRESVRAGKAVYVEWPLAENYDAAVGLFGQGRIDNSIAGLQGRVSPIALKLKELLKTGRIGRVLSSDVRAFGNLLPRDALPESLKYFAERKVGGNPITIAYAHTIDYVHDILGEFASFESRMQIQRQAIRILGSDGTQTGEIQSDVPDFLAVHGKLARGKADIVDDATLAVTFRAGQQFKGTPGFVWSINGEKGEILVTASGAYLHSDSYGEPIRIQVHDHATDEVVDVAWDWQDWQKSLPVRARIVGELYERYAHWWENGRPSGTLADGEEWPRLHDAVERLNEFRELLAQYDAGLVPL